MSRGPSSRGQEIVRASLRRRVGNFFHRVIRISFERSNGRTRLRFHDPSRMPRLSFAPESIAGTARKEAWKRSRCAARIRSYSPLGSARRAAAPPRRTVAEDALIGTGEAPRVGRVRRRGRARREIIFRPLWSGGGGGDIVYGLEPRIARAEGRAPCENAVARCCVKIRKLVPRRRVR